MFEGDEGRTWTTVRGWGGSSALWALLGLALVGAVARFATLDTQSFFLDETVTVTLMQKSLGGMLGALPDSESAPPLYYTLLWFWGKVFGTGEVGLRSLSAVFGVAMIPAAYLAVARLASVRVALFATALVALNPLLVWYSQEARVYALFALLSTLGLLAFAAAYRHKRAANFYWWAAISAVTLLTHYFAAFLILPQAVLLLRRYGLRRELVAGCSGLALVALALLPLAIVQRGGTDWITDNSLPSRVADTGVQFLAGPAIPSPKLIGPLIAVVVVLALWLLIFRGDRAERRPAALAAVIGVVGIGIPFVLAVGGLDIFIQKSMIGAWLPLAIPVAAGFAVHRSKRLGTAAATLLCGLWIVVLVAVATTPTLQRDEWRGAAQELGVSEQERLLLVNPADAGGPHRQAIETYIPDARAATFDTAVAEIDLLSLNDSGLDAQIEGVPPLPEIETPPGFELIDRIEDERFVLLRYRAEEPHAVPEWAREIRAELEDADRGATKALLIPPGAEVGS